MPLPTADTVVSYPDGDTASTGTVLHVEPITDGRSAVVLDRTAFHPVDTAWPDQPSDRGVLRADEGTWPIVEGVTGGIADGRLVLGADLPVRTGTAGWVFVVAHMVTGTPPAVGETVRVEVDGPYRRALSAGHTACHLASLALDAALADAWAKPAPTDSLGSPAFDSLAIQSSRIEPDGSTDVYRIGKSLRRKGFRVEALDELDAVRERVDALLAEWITGGGPVRIEREGRALSDRRRWVCHLPTGTAEIPCGGTHVTDVSRFERITVSLQAEPAEGGLAVTMRTRCLPPAE